ncbi:MAG: hypothetical protein IFJ96_05065, partial [Acidobacteria bacterium]|nr:hypothetical protein [Candidatus Sulfomarinibacter sp. MAG AM2]
MSRRIDAAEVDLRLRERSQSTEHHREDRRLTPRQHGVDGHHPARHDPGAGLQGEQHLIRIAGGALEHGLDPLGCRSHDRQAVTHAPFLEERHGVALDLDQRRFVRRHRCSSPSHRSSSSWTNIVTMRSKLS